jgi:putative transposase
MTEQQRLEKNNSIKLAMQATHTKRKNQVCSVYKVKIQENKLSKLQKEQLKMMFIEAKWLINSVLNSSEKIWNYDTKSNKVQVRNKNLEFETREIKYLGSQMKQSVVSEMLASIKTLSTLKKKGKKIGKLKFRSECKSLDLKQYGTTYKIKSSKRMKIQNISGLVPVNGLDQLTEDLELANAKILNTPMGYYLAITTYKKKETEEKKYLEEIGIDMGCMTAITCSDGEKIHAFIEETEKLKLLQRKLERQKKGSNNRNKTRKLLQKEYQYLSNQKNDLANKIVARLLEHEKIYMQDEQLSNWKKNGHGKAIQHSILGRVKAKLVKNPRVIVLSKWEPTTKLCIVCGNEVELKQSDRTFKCSCGVEEDRDIHAAKNMIYIIRQGLTEIKPVETKILEATSLKSNLVAEAGRSHPLGCD